MSPTMWFRLLGLSAALLLLGFLVPGLAQGTKGKKYALLVGVTKYKYRGLADLKYPENDVQELARELRKGGYKVTLLSDKEGKSDGKFVPTQSNFQAQFDRLLKLTTKHDTLLLAFSGHGLQVANTRDVFFCPQDGRKHDVKTLLSLSAIYKQLDSEGAGINLLLVDACRDMANSADRSGFNEDNAPRPPRGVAALFSCSAGQKAWETDKLGKGHGVFFYRVLEGLRGKARDDKGRVTWDDLQKYVREQVPDDVPKLIAREARQEPHLMSSIQGRPPVLLAGDGRAVVKQPEIEPVVKPKRKPDKEITNSIGMKLVLVPNTKERFPRKGTFTMGSPGDEKGRDTDEGPQHEVDITKAFYLGVYEVTQKQYRTVMGKNPSYFSSKGGGKDKVKGLDTDDFPVEHVSWQEAVDFCNKLSKEPAERKAGRVYRLPTEAEWEYACRAGTTTAYHVGDDLDVSQANFGGEPLNNKPLKGARRRTCKVGSYPPNAFGLHDMHGNVWEWCSDWYDRGYYAKSPTRDPMGPDHQSPKGESRVIRGGSWRHLSSTCRSALRDCNSPDLLRYFVGFRVAVDLPAR